MKIMLKYLCKIKNKISRRINIDIGYEFII